MLSSLLIHSVLVLQLHLCDELAMIICRRLAPGSLVYPCLRSYFNFTIRKQLLEHLRLDDQLVE